MDQIQWGIIGCGNVTEVKSGPAFNKVANSKLVAVMRRDVALAEDYAKRHNVPKWYGDVDELINDPEVNAVYIATPPNVHEAYAEKAMRAGKPVYVEKPMAMNAEECRRMNAVSQQTGVPLFVAYYRRSLPYFIKIKELIDSHILGDIRYVNICLQWQPYDEEVGTLRKPKWRVQPEISGGGHFHDLASHQFDLLEYMLGPIKNAKGIARNQAGLYDADDITVASFEFESGVLGNGVWCFTINKEQREDKAQIVGSRGSISFSFFEKFDILVETESGSQAYTIPYPTHVQQPLIDQIVKELRGEGISPSSGLTGARANLIMDWITKPNP